MLSSGEGCPSPPPSGLPDALAGTFLTKMAHTPSYPVLHLWEGRGSRWVPGQRPVSEMQQMTTC